MTLSWIYITWSVVVVQRDSGNILWLSVNIYDCESFMKCTIRLYFSLLDVDVWLFVLSVVVFNPTYILHSCTKFVWYMWKTSRSPFMFETHPPPSQSLVILLICPVVIVLLCDALWCSFGLHNHTCLVTTLSYLIYKSIGLVYISAFLSLQ